MEFIYRAIDEEAEKLLESLADLEKIFEYLMLRFGNAQEAADWLRRLQKSGRISRDYDVEKFLQTMLEQGKVTQDAGEPMQISPMGEKLLRDGAFEEIFSSLVQAGSGHHRTGVSGGSGGEMLSERRPWVFGDDMAAVDFKASLFNSVRRSGGFDLSEDDLEVAEFEKGTSCATALCIDISHSMILYGEDRITPAKKLALGFAAMIEKQFPQDELSVISFGDEAAEVPASKISSLAVGPFHTNTRDALSLSRKILLKKKSPNRRVFMITDGKPSCLKEPDGRFYKNPFGLDPKIVSKTLDEAVFLRKNNIELSVWMIAEDEELRGFVDKMAELAGGRAFFASPDSVASYVLKDYVKNRVSRRR